MLDPTAICAAGTWSAVQELAAALGWGQQPLAPLAEAWLAPRLGAPRRALRAAVRLAATASSTPEAVASDAVLVPAATAMLRTRGSAAVIARCGDQPDPAHTPELAAVIGLALANLGDRSQGRELILAAIRHAPNAPLPVRARARLEELVGERRRALRLAGEALELADHCPESRALRARLLGESGRRDDARALLQTVARDDELDLLLVWRAALADADNDHAEVAACARVAIDRPYLEPQRLAWWQRRLAAAEAPMTARPRRVRLSLPRARGPVERAVVEALVRFWGKPVEPVTGVMVDAPWLPLAAIRSHCAAAGMRSVVGGCDPAQIPDLLDRGLPVVLAGLNGRHPIQVVVGCEPHTGELLVRPVYRRWATPLAARAIGPDVVAMVVVPETRERMLSHAQLPGSAGFDAAFAAVMAAADDDDEGAEELLTDAARDAASAGIVARARRALGLAGAADELDQAPASPIAHTRAGSGDRFDGLVWRATVAQRAGDHHAAWQWWRRAAHVGASEPAARQAWLAAWRAGERETAWQWLVQRCTNMTVPSAGLGTAAWAWLIGGSDDPEIAESLVQAMLVHLDRAPADELMPAVAERWWPWIPGIEAQHVPEGSAWQAVRQAIGAEPPAPGQRSGLPPALPASDLARLPQALAQARHWLGAAACRAWSAAWAADPGNDTLAARLSAAALAEQNDDALDRLTLHRCLADRDDQQIVGALRGRIMARPQHWEPRWRAWAMAPLAAMGSLQPDPSQTAGSGAAAAAGAAPPTKQPAGAAPVAAAGALAWAAAGAGKLEADPDTESAAEPSSAPVSSPAVADRPEESSEERPVPRDLRQALRRGDGDGVIAAACHCLTAGDTPAEVVSAVIAVCQAAGFRSALRAHLRTRGDLKPAVITALDLEH